MPPGGLLNFGPSQEGGGELLERGTYQRGGTYLKFFGRQRKNYTMSMEFEMLLLHYMTNATKN